MWAKSWILGSALGLWAVSSLLSARVVSPKCSFTSWKRLQLDVTPEEAQRDGRNRPPGAAGLSNPMDVGGNPGGSCPAQKPPAVALEPAQHLGSSSCPAGRLWVGFGFLEIRRRRGKSSGERPQHTAKESELSPGLWLCRGILALKSPWEVKWENVLEQGHLFTL